MSGGGTAVSGRPAWHWVAAAAVAGVVGLAVVLGGSDKKKNSQARDVQLDEMDEMEMPLEEGIPSVPLPESSDAPSSLEEIEEQVALADSDDVPSLLAALRGEDTGAAFHAKRKLEAMGKKQEAIAVLWEVVKTGDTFTRQRSETFLEEWEVPRTYDRSNAHEPQKTPGKPEWISASVEVQGDRLVLEMDFWYGELLFDGPSEAWVELSARGGTLQAPAILKFAPKAGDNRVSKVVASGVGPGNYDLSILLWGQNRETQVQYNVGGPSLQVQVP